jgi:hypothetical protein
MAVDLDFPPNPAIGQQFSAPNGVLYVYDGFGWTAGFFTGDDQLTLTVGQIIRQVRVLLQDQDVGHYRYPDIDLIMNLNHGMSEMFRIRPDLFLKVNFIIPVYSGDLVDVPVAVEQQYAPSLVYFVVGLTQARDDESTQDARAAAFMKIFSASLMAPG